MAVSCIYAKELEGIVDTMIEVGNDPMQIIDCCKDAVIVSLLERGEKEASDKIKKGQIK